jgi:hypothetical protein
VADGSTVCHGRSVGVFDAGANPKRTAEIRDG